jgi:cytochrome c
VVGTLAGCNQDIKLSKILLGQSGHQVLSSRTLKNSASEHARMIGRKTNWKEEILMKIKAMVMAVSAALLSLGLVGNAAAADGAALYKEKACFSCHGQDAKTPLMPAYPKIAGQSAEYAYNQMKDIASGARSNGQSAAMKAIIAAVSDEEMKALAEWLATQ